MSSTEQPEGRLTDNEPEMLKQLYDGEPVIAEGVAIEVEGRGVLMANVGRLAAQLGGRAALRRPVYSGLLAVVAMPWSLLDPAAVPPAVSAALRRRARSKRRLQCRGSGTGRPRSSATSPLMRVFSPRRPTPSPAAAVRFPRLSSALGLSLRWPSALSCPPTTSRDEDSHD